MEWRDTGILLLRRRHGESAAIVEVFTKHHGRHAGIVRGGGGRRMTPILEPGNQVDATWRARLEDHLGTFTIEPVEARAAALMGDRMTLAGLNALTSLLTFALPEREAHPALYGGTLTVLDMKELDYISSAGLRVIFKAAKEVKAAGNRLAAANRKPHIDKVFEILKALPDMAVFANDEEMDEYLGAMQQQVKDDQ